MVDLARGCGLPSLPDRFVSSVEDLEGSGCCGAAEWDGLLGVDLAAGRERMDVIFDAYLLLDK